jgi:hypothetical protein
MFKQICFLNEWRDMNFININEKTSSFLLVKFIFHIKISFLDSSIETKL